MLTAPHMMLFFNPKVLIFFLFLLVALLMSIHNTCYGKCPKNSNTKVSDKMTYANSADPDQTAPEGAV